MGAPVELAPSLTGGHASFFGGKIVIKWYCLRCVAESAHCPKAPCTRAIPAVCLQHCNAMQRAAMQSNAVTPPPLTLPPSGLPTGEGRERQTNTVDYPQPPLRPLAYVKKINKNVVYRHAVLPPSLPLISHHLHPPGFACSFSLPPHFSLPLFKFAYLLFIRTPLSATPSSHITFTSLAPSSFSLSHSSFTMVAIENPVTDETKTDQPVKPSTNPDSENSIADDAPTSEAAATDAPPAEPEKDNDDAEAADDDDANVDDDDDDKDDADYQADDDDDDDPDADDDDKDALPADPAVAKDVVKHLVSSGKLGTKPLHAAAAADEADTIKNLLADDAKDKVDINEVDAYDYTAVHVAAERGSVAALQALAEAGADLERPTKMHNSRPLHYGTSAQFAIP